MAPSTPHLVVAVNKLIYRATSSDGPWTTTGISQSGDLAASRGGLVCYADNVYVVIDSIGIVRTSADSTNWTGWSQNAAFGSAVNAMAGPNYNLFDPSGTGVGSSWPTLTNEGGYFFLHTSWGNMVSRDGTSWIPIPIGLGSANSVSPIAYEANGGRWYYLLSTGKFVVSGPDPTIASDWVTKSNYLTGSAGNAFISVNFGRNGIFYATRGRSIYRAVSTPSSPVYNQVWTSAIASIPEFPTYGQYINGSYVIFTDAYGKVYVAAGSAHIDRFTISSAYANGSSRGIALVDKYIIYGDYGSDQPPTSNIMASTTLTGAYTQKSVANIGLTDAGDHSILGMAYAFPYSVPTSVTPSSGTITTDTPLLGASITRFPGDEDQRVTWQLDTVNTFNSGNLKTVSSPWAPSSTTTTAVSTNVSTGSPITSNGTWYLRARAEGRSGAFTGWTSAVSFTVALATITVPTSVTVGSLNDYWPSFSATLSVIAGYNFYAEWQVANDAAFTDIIANYSTATAVASGTVSPPRSGRAYSAGTYYVRCRRVTTSGRASSYATSSTFTIDPYTITSVPTAITSPVGTVARSTPAYGLAYPADTRMVYPRKYAVEMQVASDAGFTTNVQSAILGNPDSYLPANVIQAYSGAGEISLIQAVWFVRFRQLDDVGMVGSWSTGYSFTVSHPPNAMPSSPPNGGVQLYGPTDRFIWSFQDSDPQDAQTQAEVIVRRASDSVILYDVTQVGSAQSMAIALDASIKLVPITWQVRVWDTDGVAGPFSTPWAAVFADQPTLSITSPSTGTIATGRPVISWTLSGGSAQKSYQVNIIRQSDGKIVWTSNGTTAQTITPNLNVLVNGVTYIVSVSATNAVDLNASSSVLIITSFEPPDTPIYSVDFSDYSDLGYIDINWAGTTPDDSFYSWVVYRQEIGVDSDWQVLFTTTDASVTEYHDWSAITGHSYQYGVAQDADRFGLLLESSLQGFPAPETVQAGGWWLIDDTDESNNLSVHTTADTYSEEYEEATYTVIGRGRRREIGTRVGVTGSLTASIKPSPDGAVTAAMKIKALLDLRSQRAELTLRDPFGTSYKIAIGAPQWQHEPGYGPTEIITATIPIDEVY